MNSNANNNKQQQQKVHSNSCENNFFRDLDGFHMDIKDEFTDPLENMLGFNDIENRMLNALTEEEKNPRTEEQKQQIRPKMTNGTCISQCYSSSYSNINGKPHQECYQSQSIEQVNDGHDISEVREAYKNSDGLMKSAYQRGLDKKGARFIKEKNTKTGVHNQHKILRGIKENEIDNFNKEYNSYSKKCGFKNNYKALHGFGPKVEQNHKQLADGKANKNRN
jgi:hypothetical protein